MNRTCVATAAALVALAGGGWAAPAHGAPPSTTTLTLSSPTSAYGQTVTASAQVALPGGTPDGDVLFIVDGTPIKANLRGDGTASITLPRAVVGTHSVVARFVQFPDQQQGSDSAPATWVVAQARTFVQVRVTGRGAHTPTAVVIGAVGDFGTRPTGAVSVSVRHLGTGKVTRRQRTLDQAGAATARLGILRTGRYRLRVTYAGDAQHLLARYTEKFTVRQR
ncbi:Ig-like domain-containing protein [Nocardioides baculatus]|uniref:Ig-like domain repeat protein n=1 Tax=Nocardioides baculatus TaxID=2801337 RepID=A0ABS1LEX9_9ACTN|nr:Ig-like domain-containing protein [Nocardioides baculatus]MBL0749587.1 Ig-like domain repeat protein [Nocardioides baculatus]